MLDPNVPYRLIRKHVLEKALKDIPESFNIHNVALTYILKRTDGNHMEVCADTFPRNATGWQQ